MKRWSFNDFDPLPVVKKGHPIKSFEYFEFGVPKVPGLVSLFSERNTVERGILFFFAKASRCKE